MWKTSDLIGSKKIYPILSWNLLNLCNQLKTSAAYAKQANDTVERLIQEYCTCTWVILFACNLPNSIWPEVLLHLNFLWNRLPASRIDVKTPLKIWNPDTGINYTKLPELTTPAFFYVYRDSNAKGKKLLPRSVSKYFSGMESNLFLIQVHIPQINSLYVVLRPTSEYKEKLDLVLSRFYCTFFPNK